MLLTIVGNVIMEVATWAVKMFAFARFEPPPWVVSYNPDPAEASSGDIVLDVAEDAPPQTDRPLLKTTVQALPLPQL